MIITCPHCQTRYEVAAEAIGARGRQVQCAQCLKAWSATAPRPQARPPVLAESSAPVLGPEDEDRLDAALRSEAAAAIAPTPIRPGRAHSEEAPPPLPPPDAALLRKRQLAFFRRQNSIRRRLPMARVRRGARVGATLVFLAILFGIYQFRVELVTEFPALADLYASAGLPVNVVGLEFRELTTVRTIRGDADVLTVSFQIAATAGHTSPVPPVIVTLLDRAGAPLYEWSVTAPARELEPGAVVALSTQLTAPPPGASQIRLGFGATRQLATGDVPDRAAPSSGAETGHVSGQAGDPHAGGTGTGVHTDQAAHGHHQSGAQAGAGAGHDAGQDAGHDAGQGAGHDAAHASGHDAPGEAHH